MERDTSAWTRFSSSGFGLEFSYPDPTPLGQAVVRDDHPFLGYARVHVSSCGGELYLEVVRFHDLAPRDEYERHKPNIERRFGIGSVSALVEAGGLEWPAHTYRFGWSGEQGSGERAVLLLQVERETYRFITDPSSELNARVIATITSSAATR